MNLLKRILEDYQRHNVAQLAAAISYYALFSVAPLIIVLVEIGGFFLNSHAAVRGELFDLLGRSASPAIAATIEQLVDSTFAATGSGLVAQLVGWGAFVLGAVGFFGAIQSALNTIWDAPLQVGGWRGAVRSRALSFALILGIAFAVLALVAAGSILGGLSAATTLIPPLLEASNFALTFLIESLLFAVLFKVLPEAEVAWRDAIPGGAITAALFGAGQAVLGWYLARPGTASAYGAFGSIVILLVWVNYSAQIVLGGALFTKARADRA